MITAASEKTHQPTIDGPHLYDAVPLHPPDPGESGGDNLLARATAGQQAARTVLREAIGERHPIILLFGETGVGKSTLIQSVLASTEAQSEITFYFSATGGEFVGPPTFDAFLNIVCQRITEGETIRERPAMLAVLASAVAAHARAERTVVFAVDHADHLGDKFISELLKLPDYLNADPKRLVRIFVGSAALASRLDSALRKPGAIGRRFVEIRLPQPTAEEVATLLAYEDMAQPGGPMLTTGAIERISAYAKSNLHWAVPLADAARALALHQGVREVTPELVGGALLELWPPAQQQSSLEGDRGSEAPMQGLSDGAPVSFAPDPDNLAAGYDQASSAVAQASRPTAGTPSIRPQLLRWTWIVAAALILATVIGGLGFLFGKDTSTTTISQPPQVATERAPAPQPGPPPSSAALPEGSADSSASLQPPAQDAQLPSTDQPPANEAAEEPAAPRPAEDEPKAPAVSPPASPVVEAPVAKAPVAKKAPAPSKSKGIKKNQERSETQWIQRR